MVEKGVLGPLDAGLDFGVVSIPNASTSAFPNIIDMNTSNADGLEVVAALEADAVGGTDAQLILEGSAKNSGDYVEIATSEKIKLAALNERATIRLGVPRFNGYRYLKLSVKTTGAFSGGKLHGWLDTYIGR